MLFTALCQENVHFRSQRQIRRHSGNDALFAVSHLYVTILFNRLQSDGSRASKNQHAASVRSASGGMLLLTEFWVSVVRAPPELLRFFENECSLFQFRMKNFVFAFGSSMR